ncbi:MAG: NAD metabolism ATPase/kinase [Flavobacteriaceae bacterium]|nr:NAD metabolism ATPase/kinase [Flavobacteriaceae bacterium]
MLQKKDVQQIEKRGLTLKQVVSQLETFAKGIPPMHIVTAASIGNGIEQISETSKRDLISLYDEIKSKKTIVKFVPASGAATRMFKFLFEFLEGFNPEEETFNKYVKKGNLKQLDLFASSLKEFAFVNEVRKKIRENYPEYKQSKKGVRLQYFVKSMLEKQGLNFANLPKGLIPFHKYTKYATTAFEEQLYESALYATSKSDAYLHFTFSEAHVQHFKEEFEAVKNRVSKKTKTEFHISYSFQKRETDTLAVTPDNKPFRDENDALVFRPSGHGALLENLNEVEADIVFIKNIDNVTAQEYSENSAEYKKMLAGKLLSVQEKAFKFLELLNASKAKEEDISEIKSFLWNELSIKDIPSSSKEIFELLNRPIRVCGMVKNTGAPGGGPFWVKDANGATTLQIVEMAQIDTTDSRQMNLVNEATHFNPVDLVCGVKDFKGNKFNLTQFSNPDTGFISNKSQYGRPLKALELPGLWNGAMAHWNTILVEVPLSTFNPVKTVNDLLHKEHRPNA